MLRRPSGEECLFERLRNSRRFLLTLSEAEALQGRAQASRGAFLGTVEMAAIETAAIAHQLHVPVMDPDISSTAVTHVAPDLQRSPHVVNIRHDGLLADDGVSGVVRRFYEELGDDYDFLAIHFLARDYAWPTHYVAVRNTVVGTGVGVFDGSSAYGADASRRLRGLVMLMGGLDLGHQVVSHEIGHCCINFLHEVALSAGSPHWPLSSTGFSVMGPYAWMGIAPLGNGDYRVERVPPPYTFNELELYLLGLAPASAVPDQLVFPPQQIEILPGAIIRGPATVVTIDEIVAANGERVPAFPAAQTSFRMAAVVVSRERLLSPDEMAFYEFMAARGEALAPLGDEYTFPFHVTTRGRGTLSTSIP